MLLKGEEVRLPELEEGMIVLEQFRKDFDVGSFDNTETDFCVALMYEATVPPFQNVKFFGLIRRSSVVVVAGIGFLKEF